MSNRADAVHIKVRQAPKCLSLGTRLLHCKGLHLIVSPELAVSPGWGFGYKPSEFSGSGMSPR